MKVLSLFDGMSCGQLALHRAGIPVTQYFASEIDKHAITVAQKNFPNTIQMGDVRQVRQMASHGLFNDIDLLIGGSPCQGFSFAGKQLAFDDPRSALFFEYVWTLAAIRSANPNVKFLLENVKMKKEHLDVISQVLGVQPILINSALVSAQNRNRYYWANWSISQPADKGILLRDIIESGEVDRDKSLCIDAHYYKGGSLKNFLEKNSKGEELAQSEARLIFDHQTCFMGGAVRGRYVEGDSGATSQRLEINGQHKSNALTCVEKDSVVVFGENLENIKKREARQLKHIDAKSVKLLASMHKGSQSNGMTNITDGLSYRKLTPIECERLQTVPDNYTEGVSNSQRYRMLGNGWTIDVIAHIFGCMK